jgi:hypothetical protein
MTETLYDGRRFRLRSLIEEGQSSRLGAKGVSHASRRVIPVFNELVAVDALGPVFGLLLTCTNDPPAEPSDSSEGARKEVRHE